MDYNYGQQTFVMNWPTSLQCIWGHPSVGSILTNTKQKQSVVYVHYSMGEKRSSGSLISIHSNTSTYCISMCVCTRLHSINEIQTDICIWLKIFFIRLGMRALLRPPLLQRKLYFFFCFYSVSLHTSLSLHPSDHNQRGAAQLMHCNWCTMNSDQPFATAFLYRPHKSTDSTYILLYLIALL